MIVTGHDMQAALVLWHIVEKHRAADTLGLDMDMFEMKPSELTSALMLPKSSERSMRRVLDKLTATGYLLRQKVGRAHAYTLNRRKLDEDLAAAGYTLSGWLVQSTAGNSDNLSLSAENSDNLSLFGGRNSDNLSLSAGNSDNLSLFGANSPGACEEMEGLASCSLISNTKSNSSLQDESLVFESSLPGNTSSKDHDFFLSEKIVANDQPPNTSWLEEAIVEGRESQATEDNESGAAADVSPLEAREGASAAPHPPVGVDRPTGDNSALVKKVTKSKRGSGRANKRDDSPLFAAMVAAVAQLCDLQVGFSGRVDTEIRRLAGALLRAGYSPERLLSEFPERWRQTWRGQRGQVPSLRDVEFTMAQNGSYSGGGIAFSCRWRADERQPDLATAGHHDVIYDPNLPLDHPVNRRAGEWLASIGAKPTGRP